MAETEKAIADARDVMKDKSDEVERQKLEARIAVLEAMLDAKKAAA